MCCCREVSKLEDEVHISRGNARQFVLAKIGEKWYGFDVGYVGHIIRVGNIVRVPGSQPYWKGMICLHDEVVAVMSLRLRMKLAEDTVTDDSRILVMHLKEQGTFGVLADEAGGIIELAEEEIVYRTKTAEESKSDMIFGIGRHKDEIVSLIDISAVVGESENF